MKGLSWVVFASVTLAAGACSLASLDGYATGPTGAGGTSATGGSPSATAGGGHPAATSAGTGGAGTSSSGKGSSGTTSSATTSSATTSSSTSSSAGGACGAGGTCVVPPQGWQGPIVLALGDMKGANCTDPDWQNPVPAVDGMTGIVPPSGCEPCSCNAPTITCPTTAQLQAYANSQCTSLDQTYPVSTSCSLTGVGNYFKGSRTTAQVTCTGATPSPTSQATFANKAIGCSATSPSACQGTGTCVVAAHGPVCIYAAGTTPCPPAYPNQTMVYGGLMNNYTCTQCNCTGSASTCAPRVGLYYYPCTGSAQGDGNLYLDGTSCVAGPSGGASQAKILDVGTPTPATCSVVAGGGQLTGDATGTNPVTVCCSG